MPDKRDKHDPKTPPPAVAEQLAPPGPFPKRPASDPGSPLELDDLGDEDTPHLMPTWDGDTATRDPDAADRRDRKRIKEITRGVVETSKVVNETATVAAVTSERVEDANTGITTLRIETRAHVERIGNHLVAQDGQIGELKDDVGQVKGDIAAVKGDVAAVKGDVAGVKGDVKALTAHMDHVRKTTDNIVPALLDQLTKDRDAKREEEHVVLTAQVDIGKHQKIAEVEVEKHHEIAVAEVEKTKELAAIEDTAARAEFQRKWKLKVIGIIGTIAAGIVAVIEILLHS